MAAIAITKPALIVPTDDVAAFLLHRIYQIERANGEAGAAICALIARSLGSAEGYSLVQQRGKVMELATSLGIRVPRTAIVSNGEELEQWLAGSEFPVVLKADGTWGGVGVRAVQSIEQAKKALKELQVAPLASRSRYRRILRRIKRVFSRALRHHHTTVIAQEFVTGRPTISEVACWQGEVLGRLHFEVLGKQYQDGPSSVVRLIDNEEMDFAVRAIARKLNLSGLHGFDFIMEEGTDHPYMIEMNPRATQVGHLAFGAGRDLLGALHAAVTGIPQATPHCTTDNRTIALFPQEWLSNPTSPYLESGFHDVPWEEPELVRTCILNGTGSRSRSPKDNKWIPDVAILRALSPSGD
jgi:hypothetical protein